MYTLFLLCCGFLFLVRRGHIWGTKVTVWTRDIELEKGDGREYVDQYVWMGLKGMGRKDQIQALRECQSF